MTPATAIPGSYRDPAGRVFMQGEKVLRVVSPAGATDYEHVRDAGIARELIASGRLIDAREVEGNELGRDVDGAAYVLEHPRVDPITYPYEWPFGLLQRAAAFHLELHLDALEHGATLVDSSAYNVQFEGIRPIFIDYLSIRPYREGEPWAGHRQFLEQFVNPLLLGSTLGIAHQAWYRGALEGVPSELVVKVIPWRHRLNWRVLSHLVAPTWLQRRARKWSTPSLERAHRRSLGRDACKAMLRDTLNWVKGLRRRSRGGSVWGAYADSRCYPESALAAKRDLVVRFASEVRPNQLWDIGCNDGEMGALALSNGARRVIGIDTDEDALESAVRRAERGALDLLPLAVDVANPSPAQGWRDAERAGLMARARPDAVLALALIHHLSIGRNIPLPDATAFIAGFAPRGLVEFVPRSDPMVERMLAAREDVFTDYEEAVFTKALEERAQVVRRVELPGCDRVVFWYERR